MVGGYLRVTLFCVLAAGSTVIAAAQSLVLELPRPSQGAKITQRVGITDITIPITVRW